MKKTYLVTGKMLYHEIDFGFLRKCNLYRLKTFLYMVKLVWTIFTKENQKFNKQRAKSMFCAFIILARRF